MRRFLLIFLCLALPLSAAPKATPIPMAKPRTAAEDALLRDWIVGIQKAAEVAETRADSAEAEAKSSRDQSAIAAAKLTETQTHLNEIQTAYDKMANALAAAIAKAAKFGKLVLILSFVAALMAALYTFEMLKPAGLLGKLLSVSGPGIQYGAPVVVFAIVFGGVQIYLRYFF